MNIAIFLSEYPALNETFISNELFLLQQSGVRGHIYYQESSKMTVAQPLVEKIFFPKTRILSQGKLWSRASALFVTHVGLFIHAPRRYVQTVFMLMSILTVDNLRYFLRASLLVRSLVEKNTELIYIHDSVGISIIGLFCKSFTGVPGGIIFHTFGLFADNRLLRNKISFSDFSIFQSYYSRSYAKRVADVPRYKANTLHVISSSGVDTRFFSPPPFHRRLLPSHIRIICVARLEEMKRIDELIRAIYLLKKNVEAVRCIIVGYGTQRGLLVDLVRSLRLQREVVLMGPLGHTSKLKNLLRASDIFVLPSAPDRHGDRDMQPNAVKEAMSAGLLVVTSDLGGIREVIQDGVSGFLLRESTGASIAEKILYIMRLSKEKREAVRVHARATIRNKYESIHINEQLMALFHAFVKAKPSP